VRLNLKFGWLTVLTIAASLGFANTLELKNDSLIKGKFLGGTERETTVEVGSTVDCA
jgi:hypothetical protein